MTETNQAQTLVTTLRDALHQLESALERTREGVEAITSHVARLREGIKAPGTLRPWEVSAVGVDMLVDATTAWLAAFREQGRRRAVNPYVQPTDLKRYYNATALVSTPPAQHHVILHSAPKAAQMHGVVTRNVATLVMGKPRVSADLASFHLRTCLFQIQEPRGRITHLYGGIVLMLNQPGSSE